MRLLPLTDLLDLGDKIGAAVLLFSPFVCRRWYIFLQWETPGRSDASAPTWGVFAKGLLSPAAINDDKLEEEEYWSTERIILAFADNTQDLNILLPDAKIAGARALLDVFLEHMDSKLATFNIPQQLRGNLAHFKATDVMWGNLCGPVDTLMGYGDEQTLWADFPFSSVWAAFWDAIRIPQSMCEPGERWGDCP